VVNVERCIKRRYGSIEVAETSLACHHELCSVAKEWVGIFVHCKFSVLRLFKIITKSCVVVNAGKRGGEEVQMI